MRNLTALGLRPETVGTKFLLFYYPVVLRLGGIFLSLHEYICEEK